MPTASKAFFLFHPPGNECSPTGAPTPLHPKENAMRRELEIRCVSTGTIRTEGPDGTRCELREVFLELDGAPARLQILESHDHDQHTRDVTVELDGICVRSRRGHDVRPPPTSTRHMPLDWLLAIAAWMRKGEHRTVSLWVRSMDPAALLSATPRQSVRRPATGPGVGRGHRDHAAASSGPAAAPRRRQVRDAGRRGGARCSRPGPPSGFPVAGQRAAPRSVMPRKAQMDADPSPCRAELDTFAKRRPIYFSCTPCGAGGSMPYSS